MWPALRAAMLASAITGLLANFWRSHSTVRLALAAEHPHHQAQRPHVLAAQRLLGAEPNGLDRLQGELGDVDLEDAVGAELLSSSGSLRSRPS
jgi:hypothetical protein